MILSELKLWNYRKFRAGDNGEPGLVVKFHKGINALVGENDSGKSAIIDAIKLVILTQSGEYLRPSEDDFFTSLGYTAEEIRIECKFEQFSENEAKNFLEWLEFKKKDDGVIAYSLTLFYRAWKEGKRIFTDLKAGDADSGISIDGKARELLKCVYLRPLRDAAREMSGGRGSRLSQILYSHPVFREEDESELVTIFKETNRKIEEFFINENGSKILKVIRTTLNEFIEHEEEKSNSPALRTSEIRLKTILENLSLSTEETMPGLGSLNLLFIAAELLLLNENASGGLPLALIEELEAHLHPQAQLRLMAYLQKQYNDSGVQIIISTHSTILASKIDIKNIILVKNGQAYSLGFGETRLLRGDYLFLQRFLDVTKSNLFFAKGIIMVEGDAENLVLPVIADILGLNLEKHGVSIVNIGHIGFFRYARIFKRSDGGEIDVPISIVTDCDVKIEHIEGHSADYKVQETKDAISALKAKYQSKYVHVSVAPKWTFEFSIALSSLKQIFSKAVFIAQEIKRSEKTSNGDEPLKCILDMMDENQSDRNDGLKTNEATVDYAFAVDLYQKQILDSGLSKTLVAQSFANLLQWEMMVQDESVNKHNLFALEQYQVSIDERKQLELKQRIETDEYLKYLVDAIKHAAGLLQEGVQSD